MVVLFPTLPFQKKKKKAVWNHQPINSGYTDDSGTQIWDFPDQRLRKQMQLPLVCGSLSGIIFNVHNDTKISFSQPSNMKYCILLAFWGSTVIFFPLSQTRCLLWLFKSLFSLIISSLILQDAALAISMSIKKPRFIKRWMHFPLHSSSTCTKPKYQVGFKGKANVYLAGKEKKKKQLWQWMYCTPPAL